MVFFPRYLSLLNPNQTELQPAIKNPDDSPQRRRVRRGSIYPVILLSVLGASAVKFMFLETPFPFQFSHRAVVDEIFRFETANLFVVHAEQPDHIANAIDARINFSFVQIDHALITLVGVLDSSEAQGLRQTLGHLALVLRIANIRGAIEQRAQHIFHRRRRRRHKTAFTDDSRALVRNRQFFGVGQHAETFALEHLAEGVAQKRRFGGTVQHSLRHYGLLAQRSELDFVSFRHQPPIIQYQHRENPPATAQTIYRNASSL